MAWDLMEEWKSSGEVGNALILVWSANHNLQRVKLGKDRDR
jgi:hypothetical protein